jgi:Ca2+-binding EF-hand superfamily protein
MDILNSPSHKKSVDEIINSLDNEEKSKVKEIFELFDKNLDGEIDLKELKFIMNCKKNLIIKLLIYSQVTMN